MKRVVLFVCFLCCVLGVGWIFLPRPPLLDGITFSRSIRDRNQTLLRVTLSSDEKYRIFVPLREISPFMVEATLLHEDRYFYQHCGMNPVALGRALWNEVGGSGRRFGASTITMQLARIRFHLNTRTWWGKIVQIVRAAQLERHYPKDAILEAYFNLASYGGNVEGVGAASLVYFGKSASHLSLPEAMTLSVIPQSPFRRSPGASENHTRLIEARNILFAQWMLKHPEAAEIKTSLELPLQVHSAKELPFEAPHFVDRVVEEAGCGAATDTTLDLRLQRTVERILATYVRTRGKEGIQNAAAMLVDHRTMEVVAEVGSVDYFNREIQGQVPGTRVKRSPGSALKPFIYALAMDQGLIQPLSLLNDMPASFGEYSPENFDRQFTGPIHAKDALIQSRNIPAVFLESQMPTNNLYGLMKKAGVRDLQDESRYGLTIALGGAEVMAEELARLYGSLANRGRMKAVRRLKVESKAETTLFSPEAAFLTLDMLKDCPRPDGMRRSESGSPVYWKTGTSFSYRDAWTAGIFDRYVLVVWVGNFDGRSNPVFIGRTAAAPLFFQLADAIRSEFPSSNTNVCQAEGLSVRQVDLCPVSGLLAGGACPHSTKGWFIPGVSPIKTCDVHREVWVDADGTRLRGAGDSPTAKKEVFEFWSPELLASFKKAGTPRRVAPHYGGDVALQEEGGGGAGPRIMLPQKDTTYALRADPSANESVVFQAVSDAGVRKVFWFADKVFLGSSGAGERLYWKGSPGRYVIHAVDDHGGSDSCRITLTLVE